MFKHKKLQANAKKIKRFEDLIYFCARKKVKTKLLNSLLVQNEKKCRQEVGNVREKEENTIDNYELANFLPIL